MKNGPIQPLLLWFLLIVHALGFIFHKAREATVGGGDALLLIFQFVCFFFPVVVPFVVFYYLIVLTEILK